MTVTFDRNAGRDALRAALVARILGKAKPAGALGRLETLAVQIGLVTGSLTPDLGPAKIVVFAGDHGLTAEGVSAYPSVVTREIAKLILAGGAGINVCAGVTATGILLVDAGLLSPLDDHPNLLQRRMANGTANSRHAPAMSRNDFESAMAAGGDIARGLAQSGTKLLAFGEVGIGNTSAAALVAHAITGISLETLVGAGAGIPPLGLDHKRQVLSDTFARAALGGGNNPSRTAEALRQFAGFEMVMMAGAILEAAGQGCLVVIDGFIATAVAAAAIAIDDGVTGHCIFAHCSAEAGHRALLAHVGATPLLDLGLRLGEGTGAALALPIVRAAEAMLRDMADLPGEHPQ
jgi:nicotinate-nucleotide--dimethylbenzimidazole phosphoribosyltransferase